MSNNAILNLLGEDSRLIAYRPRIASFLGGVTAAILLQQILYWFVKNEQRPFYKFKEPCSHDDYREGDSWTEELAFSRHEFDTALTKIGRKLTGGKTKQDYRQAFVWYWTDGQRRTFYEVNVPLLAKVGNRLYGAKAENSLLLTPESDSSSTKSENPPLAKGGKSLLQKPESDFTYTTENTSETTQESPDSAPAKPDAPTVSQTEKVDHGPAPGTSKPPAPNPSVPSAPPSPEPVTQGALFQAFADELGADSWPPGGLTFKPFMPFMVRLVKEGYTADRLKCAAKLYQAWRAENNFPLVNWNTGLITSIITTALQLCEKGITVDAIAKYTALERAKPFWANKTVGFDFVAKNVTANPTGMKGPTNYANTNAKPDRAGEESAPIGPPRNDRPPYPIPIERRTGPDHG